MSCVLPARTPDDFLSRRKQKTKKRQSQSQSGRMKLIFKHQRSTCDNLKHLETASAHAQEVLDNMRNVLRGKGPLPTLAENIVSVILQCEDIELKYTKISVIVNIYQLAQDFAIIMYLHRCTSATIAALFICRDCRIHADNVCDAANFRSKEHHQFSEWIDVELNCLQSEQPANYIHTWSLHHLTSLSLIPVEFHSQLVITHAK